MKNTPAQSLYCAWNTVQIWGLVDGDEIIHLSFDKQHHQGVSGPNDLREVSPAKQRVMCAFLFSTLQGTAHSFPSNSPFIQKGTPFQLMVWHALSRIPFATTRTYGDIGRELGNAHLARAVGQACNKNPLPLIIPCHRVVGATGLGGFAGGSKIKKTLLDHEQKFVKLRERS